MTKPSYPIVKSVDGLWYEFESVNNNRTIKKAVGYYLYTENGEHFAELCFGDILPNGNIDLKSISNNNDMVLVICTVIFTLYNFLELYPEKCCIYRKFVLKKQAL